MILHSNMTITRNDADFTVVISGTYCPRDHSGPECIANIEAWEDRQEWLLTDAEWQEAESILMEERRTGEPSYED